jgi:4-hydroxy-tetrahydrodipicolinate synthase
MKNSKKLKGIVVPLVTPLLDRASLDIEGLEKLIEYVIDGGVKGIFVLGTTGESPCLSYRLRRELIERTCRQVSGRLPVLVGITDTSFVESVNLAKYAGDKGVDYAVIAPPYYYKSDAPELTEYLNHLLPELPVPVYLYNMPSCTKVIIDISTVKAVADNEKVVGLKDSSADMIYFNKLIQVFKGRDDFGIFVGPEELLAQAVYTGADGGVNGGANLFPKLYNELYNAVLAGNSDKVYQLQKVVMQISMTIYSQGRHPSSYLKGLKASLKIMGICNDFIAEPFHKFRDKERQSIESSLKQLDYQKYL